MVSTAMDSSQIHHPSQNFGLRIGQAGNAFCILLLVTDMLHRWQCSIFEENYVQILIFLTFKLEVLWSYFLSVLIRV